MIRQPLVVVVGHVDHGKTLILDNIRKTAIAAKEAGGITQSIGASIVPIDAIKKVCGSLLASLKMEFTIPGLLFIDTPGHAAFTTLRKRGGNLSDIAILVIDINEGFKPQTIEALEILKNSKTPFVVAANKIDLIPGWRTNKTTLLQNISQQAESVTTAIEKRLYELVGKIYEHGFSSERFDRVEDYTKQIAIIPVSAKTGEGLPELLMVLTGLAQKYLEQCLKCNVKGNAKASILEVKEDKGIGKTMDVILYDGKLSVNDQIVIGGLNRPIVTKVRALFEPMPLGEMRDKKTKFKSVKEVFAASGVKISAPDIEEVISGMPLFSATEQSLENVKEEVQKEVEEVIIATDKHGIIIKADTLGSLEALSFLLKEKGVEIRKADIGNISKKDISEAESNYEGNPLSSVVLGFNVADESGLRNEHVKILTHNIIYKLIEEFEKWKQEEEKKMEARKLESLAKPFKLKIMQGYVFRQNNPAVVGVEVVNGAAKAGTQVMKEDGRILTEIKSIEHEKESLTIAEKGKQVAMSFPRVTVGRQVNEEDVLYSVIPEEDFRKLKELKKYLSEGEISVLKEIAAIMRKTNPMWGV